MAWEVRRRKKPKSKAGREGLISVQPRDRGVFIYAKTNKIFSDCAPKPGSAVDVLVDTERTRLAFRVVDPEEVGDSETLWEVKGKESGATEIPCSEAIRDIRFVEKRYPARVFEYGEEQVLGLDWSEEFTIQYPADAKGAFAELDGGCIRLNPAAMELSVAPPEGARARIESNKRDKVLWVVPDVEGRFQLTKDERGGCQLDPIPSWLSSLSPGRYRVGIRKQENTSFLAIRYTPSGRVE